MLKIKLKNLFWTTAALFCATQFCSGQSSDILPTVGVSPARPFAPFSNSGSDLTLAGEYKSTKQVVEQEKPTCFNWYAEGGYTSEYIFRGTNLMPDSDGGGFLGAQLSRWGFTLGVWGIHQFGNARAPSWSMGESGGGGAGLFGVQTIFGFLPLTISPETVQNRFNEIDAFLEYHRQFFDGWVDITVGNIAFFIDRRAQTSFDATTPFIPFFNRSLTFPFQAVGENTVQDEQFDRLYVSLSTSKIPHITPKITYYQTIYSEGSEPFTKVYVNRNFLFVPPFPGTLFLSQHVPERNDALGGYLEGRLNGNFHITDRIDFNPYGIISVSFHDRTEPVDNPTTKREIIRGRTLSGWNHAQVGFEVPILLWHGEGVSTGPCAPPDPHLKLVPFAWYAYHIAEPDPGTDRNEWWGGAKLTLSF